MGKIIGVTGASGHLGGNVARCLLERGFEVSAFCRHEGPSLKDLGAEYFRGDILDAGRVDAFVSGCDAIVHCAGIISIAGDPDGSVYRSNVEGTRNVVEACARRGVERLIHVSSVHAVESRLDKSVFDEGNPWKERGSPAYDYSKACGEKIVLEAISSGRISGCVMRPSAIFGPYDFTPSKLGQATLDLYAGHIPVLPPGGYNFVDARDVAAAIAVALSPGATFTNVNKDIGPIYNLTGRYCSMREFAELIHLSGGARPPRLSLPASLMLGFLPCVSLWARLSGMEQAYTKEMVNTLVSGHTHMSFDRARRAFGFSPRPLEDSVRDFIQWEKSRGGLA
jgi:dihydroflavonol-4-reductase